MQIKTIGKANANKSLISDIRKYMNNCSPLKPWHLKCKILQLLWRSVYQLFLILNIQLLYEPVVLLRGEKNSWREICLKYLPRRNKNICPKMAYVRLLKAALFSSQKLETTWMSISRVYKSRYIGLSCFFKVCLMPLFFYKRPTLVPAFANWVQSKEDVCFYEKRRKAKIAFNICFSRSHCRSGMCSLPAVQVARSTLDIWA